MKDLQGRTALVTGASGGLGRRVAQRLAGEGVDVVVCGRREDALAEAVQEIQALGVRAAAVPADLADLGQAQELVGRAESALGPIDLLINNAGVEAVGSFAGFRADVERIAPRFGVTELFRGVAASRGRAG
jgi:short-subunit dehydrogenase